MTRNQHIQVTPTRTLEDLRALQEEFNDYIGRDTELTADELIVFALPLPKKDKSEDDARGRRPRR